MTPGSHRETVQPSGGRLSAQDHALRASPYLFGVIYAALICTLAIRVYLFDAYQVPFPWTSVAFWVVGLGLLHLQFARVRTAMRRRAALSR